MIDSVVFETSDSNVFKYFTENITHSRVFTVNISQKWSEQEGTELGELVLKRSWAEEVYSFWEVIVYLSRRINFLHQNRNNSSVSDVIIRLYVTLTSLDAGADVFYVTQLYAVHVTMFARSCRSTCEK